MPDAADSPIGTWRGQSTCLVKASACRDEDSVYRAPAVAVEMSRARVALIGHEGQDRFSSPCRLAVRRPQRVWRVPIARTSASGEISASFIDET
jgi:hypothetical protein